VGCGNFVGKRHKVHLPTKKSDNSVITNGRPEWFLIFTRVKQESVLFPLLLNMGMDETIRKRTEGRNCGIPKMVVYGDDILLEPNQRILDANISIQTLRICKDCGLDVNLDKSMVKKISWRTGEMEKIKFNNSEIKKVERFIYLERI
jgi:hypothetical protein